MTPFHSPFGLRARLQAPETRVDALPLVTVLLIAVLFTLAGSRFIYAPGLTVALGDGTGENAKLPTTLELPRSTQGPLPGAMTGATLTVPPVLTAKSEVMVIFNGRIYSQADAALLEAMKAAAERSPVLLLKVDRSVTMARFFALRDYAQEAGFTHVQVAGEDRPLQ